MYKERGKIIAVFNKTAFITLNVPKKCACVHESVIESDRDSWQIPLA